MYSSLKLHYGSNFLSSFVFLIWADMKMGLHPSCIQKLGGKLDARRS